MTFKLDEIDRSNPLLGKHNIFCNSVYPALDLWNRVNASTRVSTEYLRRFGDTVNNCNCSAKKVKRVFFVKIGSN